jgi:phosphoribosylaminoimidazole (AIR) synthetase
VLASVKRRHRPHLSLIHLDIGIDVARALPSVFGRMVRAGAIFLGEMVRTFNCGMGTVRIVAEAEDKVGDALRVLAQAGQVSHALSQDC